MGRDINDEVVILRKVSEYRLSHLVPRVCEVVCGDSAVFFCSSLLVIYHLAKKAYSFLYYIV